MKIDRKLNLVMPVQTESHGIVHVHSVAISREVFEQFYLELGKVFSQCFDSVNESHLVLSSPQLAYPALKSIAIKSGTWTNADGTGGVKFGLVNEIVRNTSVLINGVKGWENMPLDIAVKRGMLDEDEEAEVLSSLVFFTAICKVAPKDFKTSFLEMAGSLRNWVLTSSDCMAYKNSLPTLTKEDVIGVTVTVS